MHKELSPMWFYTPGPIDFEYKQYILLDYLQYVDLMYDNGLLYPVFHEVEYHLKNLESFRTTRELIVNGGRQLKGFDFEKMTLLYDMPQDTQDFIVVNNIVNYAEGKFQKSYNKGKSVYQEIESNISLRFVGIIPELKDFGFIIVNTDNVARIYKYEIGKIYLENENYIILDEIDTQRISLDNSYEHIKLDLLNKFNQYANPAVIAAEINKTYPLKEGIIPVMRRKLAAYLNKQF
jgi:hypothetical protein